MGMNRRNGGYIGLSNSTSNVGVFDLHTSHANSVSTTIVEPVAVNLSFYLHRYGASIGPLAVYLLDANGVVLDTVYSLSADSVNSWVLHSVPEFVATESFYIAWQHTNGADFTGDMAIDQVELNGVVYSFGSSPEGFTTSTGVNTLDSQVAFDSRITVLTNTDAVVAEWKRHSGSTGSTGTGPGGAYNGTYYLYTETTDPNNLGDMNFWLFSPLIEV